MLFERVVCSMFESCSMLQACGVRSERQEAITGGWTGLLPLHRQYYRCGHHN